MRLTLLLLALPAFAKVNFVRQVKPILEKHCVRCHGDERAAKNLRLDRQDRAMRAVVPKKPEDSTLYLAARSGIMPPGPNKLSSEERGDYPEMDRGRRPLAPERPTGISLKTPTGFP